MQNKIGTKNYSCAYNKMLHRLSTVKYLNKYLNIVIFTRKFELNIIKVFSVYTIHLYFLLIQESTMFLHILIKNNITYLIRLACI